MSRAKSQLLLLSEESRGEMLQKSLEPFGYAVVVKSTVRGMGQIYPDLIIIGSHLADATVFEACRQLRQVRYYVPLIVAVEDADEYDHILSLEIGADDYVASPISIRGLVARIRAQLRRAYEYPKAEADVWKVGDLVLDGTRGQVFLDQRSLDLTPIEFRLLKFLLQHRDQVLSRSQILSQVWGCGLQPNGEEMVNVTICRLRRKVELDPFNPTLILTVRGMGYRLASSAHSCGEMRPSRHA